MRARVTLVGMVLAAAVLVAGCTSPEPATPSSKPAEPTPIPTITAAASDAAFGGLEATFDARLGVYAIDTGTGAEVVYRADERFAYASTFKALAAAAVLQKNDLADLDRVVTYSSSDLITYSPVTELHVAEGMTLGEITEAAVRFSDNTAGNLMLDELGGPEGLTAALADIGDDVTQAVRWEAGLNDGVPGDPRDTTSPRAFATDLREFALGDALDADKQALLIDWMTGNATGSTLIRAGVPADWVVADKSGSGGYGVRNNIAIVWPPDAAPIVIAVLSTRDSPDAARDDALVAQAAAVVVDALK
ncbi:class A beta-lactamase [Conyzicola lurida]